MSRGNRVYFWFGALGLLAAGLALAPVRSRAQEQASGEVKDNGGRKVKTAVKPLYPDVARKMHITGTVRLEATVAADGKVRDTRVVGGSPMLAQEASNAVKKWKYEEGSKETVETVEVVYQ
jgi:TonB family protein